jgi:hypothetical protein
MSFFFVFSFIVYALLHSRRRLTALKKGLINALDNALLEAYQAYSQMLFITF